MAAEFLILFVFPLLLIMAAGWDIASFTIPNFLQIALIASFVAFVAATGMAPSAIATHLIAGFVGLAIGFTLFALGYIGGGDAKLFACIALWLGFHNLPEYALLSSILGGALTVILLGVRRLPLPSALDGQSWILKLHEARGAIPYGVALSAGAFFVLPQAEIFRLAATL
jgi:prepilin peptidase CpaA